MACQQDSVIRENMPVKLDGAYKTRFVNEAVCVYKGRLELERNGQAASGDGSVRLRWLPVPRLVFRIGGMGVDDSDERDKDDSSRPAALHILILSTMLRVTSFFLRS